MIGVLRKVNCTESTLKRAFVAVMVAFFIILLSSAASLPAYAAESASESDGAAAASVQQYGSESPAANEQEGAVPLSKGAHDGAAANAESKASNGELSNAEDPSCNQLNEECIDDEGNPLALIKSPGYWSLVDVVATVLASVVAAVLALGILVRRGEDEDDVDEQERRRSSFFMMASVALMASSLLGVLITQDFTQRMALFDVWSPLFLFAAVTSAVLCYRYMRADSGDDDCDGAPSTVATF